MDGLVSGDLAIGVVGLGFGANHARVIEEMEGVRLAALCDRDKGRLTAASKNREAATYDAYEAMLKGEKLDAVIVAMPEKLHVPVATAAIEAGCAVLVEKPLAPSYEEAAALVQAAASAGVALMAGHIERFNPAIIEMKRRVEAGEVGRVLHMAARRTAPRRQRIQDVNVIHDSALHDIDAMRYILGGEVESVFAMAQSGVRLPFEDSLAGVLRFAAAGEEAGVIGSLEVNWLSPLRIRELTVLGTEGILALDYAAQTLEFHQASTRPVTAPRDWSTESSHLRDPNAQIPIRRREQLAEELSAFVAALRDGTPMPISGEDALQTLAVADALTQSARSGQPVTVRRD
jgi:UDP-N-acetylglucosamine 3-dehydrogenase